MKAPFFHTVRLPASRGVRDLCFIDRGATTALAIFADCTNLPAGEPPGTLVRLELLAAFAKPPASKELPSIDFDDYADSMGMRNSAAAPRATAAAPA
jgi:hypothetical protein